MGQARREFRRRGGRVRTGHDEPAWRVAVHHQPGGDRPGERTAGLARGSGGRGRRARGQGADPGRGVRGRAARDARQRQARGAGAGENAAGNLHRGSRRTHPRGVGPHGRGFRRRQSGGVAGDAGLRVGDRTAGDAVGTAGTASARISGRPRSRAVRAGGGDARGRLDGRRRRGHPARGFRPRRDPEGEDRLPGPGSRAVAGDRDTHPDRRHGRAGRRVRFLDSVGAGGDRRCGHRAGPGIRTARRCVRGGRRPRIEPGIVAGPAVLGAPESAAVPQNRGTAGGGV